MAGVSKITEAILEEARLEAESIVAAAKKEADNEKEAALREIASDKEKAEENLEKELSSVKQKAESARDLNRRRAILSKKQEIIARIIEKTRLSLHEADTDSYFSALYKMFEKYCRPEAGVLMLNSRDLDRLPKDFSERIAQLAKAKGGSMEVSTVATQIEDGFVLKYGGTEENCTFRALIEAQKESFYDEINNMLWRSANG